MVGTTGTEYREQTDIDMRKSERIASRLDKARNPAWDDLVGRI